MSNFSVCRKLIAWVGYCYRNKSVLVDQNKNCSYLLGDYHNFCKFHWFTKCQMITSEHSMLAVCKTQMLSKGRLFLYCKLGLA